MKPELRHHVRILALGLFIVVGTPSPTMGQAQTAPLPRQYKLERRDDDLVRLERLHKGNGTIDMKFFFTGERYAFPAFLMIFKIPPGASEGVHTHGARNPELGSFDEFYYILSGRGQMQIAGKTVAVKAGDQVFTPNGVPHGIENTSDKLLEVYIVAITRD